MFGRILWNRHLYGLWYKKEQFNRDFEYLCFGEYNFSDVTISNFPNKFDGLDIHTETFSHTQHWEGLINWSMKKKVFSVSWWILANNNTDLREKVSRIKWHLLKGQQELRLRLSNKIVYTKAVVTNITLPHHSWTRNRIAIEITFSLFSPFLYEDKMVEQSFYDVKNLFYHSVAVYEGSYGSAIWLWIIFKQAPSIDTVLIWIWEKRLVIKHQFKKNDILHVDWANLNIGCNWIYGIDWIGEFGELLFWQNEIRVFIDWERTADVFIQYRPTHV